MRVRERDRKREIAPEATDVPRPSEEKEEQVLSFLKRYRMKKGNLIALCCVTRSDSHNCYWSHQKTGRQNSSRRKRRRRKR